MMNNINFNKFNSKTILAQFLAKNIAMLLKDAIEKRGEVTLLVSGGNTPKLFFEELSLLKLDWQKVKIGLVDERYLSSEDINSNENLVKNYLLINEAKNANFIGMYQENIAFIDAVEICNKTYEKEFEQIDILVLGMGIDGHTASIFPEVENFSELINLENDKFCMGVIPKTAPFDRITLSLKAILEAKNIFLHLEGEEKYQVFNEALKSKNKYPISNILLDNKKIEVYYS